MNYPEEVGSHIALQKVGQEPGELVVLNRFGQPTATYTFGRAFSIGRDEGDLAIADDVYLSSCHASFARHGGSVHVADLDSLNGVYLRAGPARRFNLPLENGDLIFAGQQVLRFDFVRSPHFASRETQKSTTALLGTPIGRGHGRVTRLGADGGEHDCLHLRARETVFGRELGDFVFPEDSALSRRHFSVRFDKSGAELVDLHSTNGSYKRLRQETPLVDGDELRVGQQHFRFRVGRDASGAAEA